LYPSDDDDDDDQELTLQVQDDRPTRTPMLSSASSASTSYEGGGFERHEIKAVPRPASPKSARTSSKSSRLQSAQSAKEVEGIPPTQNPELALQKDPSNESTDSASDKETEQFLDHLDLTSSSADTSHDVCHSQPSILKSPTSVPTSTVTKPSLFTNLHDIALSHDEPPKKPRFEEDETEPPFCNEQHQEWRARPEGFTFQGSQRVRRRTPVPTSRNDEEKTKADDTEAETANEENQQAAQKPSSKPLSAKPRVTANQQFVQNLRTQSQTIMPPTIGEPSSRAISSTNESLFVAVSSSLRVSGSSTRKTSNPTYGLCGDKFIHEITFLVLQRFKSIR
jgi:hypothetical protein